VPLLSNFDTPLERGSQKNIGACNFESKSLNSTIEMLLSSFIAVLSIGALLTYAGMCIMLIWNLRRRQLADLIWLALFVFVVLDNSFYPSAPAQDLIDDFSLENFEIDLPNDVNFLLYTRFDIY